VGTLNWRLDYYTLYGYAVITIRGNQGAAA